MTRTQVNARRHSKRRTVICPECKLTLLAEKIYPHFKDVHQRELSTKEMLWILEGSTTAPVIPRPSKKKFQLKKDYLDSQVLIGKCDLAKLAQHLKLKTRTDIDGNQAPSCPQCDGAAMQIQNTGKGHSRYRCPDCKFSADAIDLFRAVRKCTFVDALKGIQFIIKNPADERRSVMATLLQSNAGALAILGTKPEASTQLIPLSLATALPSVEAFYEWLLTTDLKFEPSDRLEFQFPIKTTKSAKIRLTKNNQPAGHVMLSLNPDEKVSRLGCFQMPVGLKRKLLCALQSAKLFQTWPIACGELKNIHYRFAPTQEEATTTMDAPKDDSDEVPF